MAYDVRWVCGFGPREIGHPTVAAVRTLATTFPSTGISVHFTILLYIMYALGVTVCVQVNTLFCCGLGLRLLDIPAEGDVNAFLVKSSTLQLPMQLSLYLQDLN